jgi:hypothetical protein
MDARIPAVIKKIIGDPEGIEETVRSGGTEFFFRYKGVVFSILRAENRDPSKFGPFSFYIYPRWTLTLGELASFSGQGQLEEPDMMSYNVVDAAEPLRPLWSQLWHLLNAKDSNLDEVFRKVLED